MTRDVWNPAQYERYRNERERPFWDLLGFVAPRAGQAALDLGCGTGELTRELHRRLRARITVGVDRSASMIERALSQAEVGLAFVRGDLGHPPLSGRFDVIFSNAAFHCVGDHEALLARLHAFLAPGGQLAIQVPANHDHPAHRLAEELAGEEPHREVLRGFVRRSPVLAPGEYARLLDALGLEEIRCEMRVYAHRLDGPEDVVEWVRGTLLTDYQRRMPSERFTTFVDEYRRRWLAAVGDARPFFFPFQRTLFAARSPA